MCVKPSEEPRALFGVPTAIPDPLKAATNPRVHAAYDDETGGETASCRVPREPLISAATDEYESFAFGFSAPSMRDEVVASDWPKVVGFNSRMGMT